MKSKSWAIAALSCAVLSVIGLIANASQGQGDPRPSPSELQSVENTGPDTVRVWEAVSFGGCATGQQCFCQDCDCEECPKLCLPITEMPCFELRIELGEPQRIEPPPPPLDDGGFAAVRLRSRVRSKHVTLDRCKLRC